MTIETIFSLLLSLTEHYQIRSDSGALCMKKRENTQKKQKKIIYMS